MKKIRIFLYGKLKEFGKSFKFEAFSTADALQLLLTQKPDLMRAINSGKFTVKVGNISIGEDELHRLVNADESLHILPVVAGRKGIGKIVIGAALIGASFIPGVGAAIGSFGASLMLSAGMGLAIYGASSFFFKPPVVDTSLNGQDQQKSSHFNSLGNNIANNTIYPFGFGTFYCGSVRVSEGVVSMRNDPNEKPKEPIAGKMEELKRVYYTGVAARDPAGNLYPTDFTNDSVKAKNYRVV